jgi:DNA polymerase III alpha subunit
VKFYRFQKCGCKFELLEELPDKDVIPRINLDIDEIPFDCSTTWELLAKGITKGVFQLESNLGKTWTKEMKPEDMEHMAALGSLLRPGCLRAIDEKHNMSMTSLYCKRKNGDMPTEIYHPSLEKVLKPTYGVLTYQEQAMEIARIIALFNLQHADELRKAMGKKLPEEMKKVELRFIEGAAKAGIVTKEQSEELFSWIKKSQRYSFNKSHALSYAILGYISAYIKAHFPIQFYTSWLKYSYYKSKPLIEIRQLISDAKLLDVEVLTPDVRNLEAHFSTDGKLITFGLSDVKGIGEAQINKLKEAVSETEQVLGKVVGKWNWMEFLCHCSHKVSSTVVKNLICVGGFRFISNNRTLLLEQYNKWSNLTDKEQEWIRYNVTMDKDMITTLRLAAPAKKDGGAAANFKRTEIIRSMANLLENPPSPLEDNPEWIARKEEELLGIAITYSRVDSCDTTESNCTCKEYLAGKTGKLKFAVDVQEVQELTVRNGTQRGRKMGRLTVTDGTCSLDMVSFPDSWEPYGSLLQPTNTVLIQAERDKRKDSLIVKKVWQL